MSDDLLCDVCGRPIWSRVHPNARNARGVVVSLFCACGGSPDGGELGRLRAHNASKPTVYEHTSEVQAIMAEARDHRATYAALHGVLSGWSMERDAPDLFVRLRAARARNKADGRTWDSMRCPDCGDLLDVAAYNGAPGDPSLYCGCAF